MPIPEDAQLSEDGQWWWDGTNWNAVDEPQASYDTSTTSDGQIDVAGLIQTLTAIAEMDEIAAASSSSSELDTWIESLSEWQSYLSQSQPNA